MKKEFKMCPTTKFITWLILGLIICIIGISNVFADTYSYNQFTAQLYDNYGPTLSAVTTDQTNGRWQGAIPTMTASSSGAAWGISSNMVLLANHTYTLTAEITGTYGGRLVLSTYNRIGVGTTLANAKTSYQNNTYVTENYSRVLDNGYTIQFAFTPTTNGSYIVFPFATNYTGSNQYFYLSTYTLDDLGSSGGVSESTINNSLNSQTNVLNQSITNSQNAIIQNNNDNTQAIIDSNKENFNTCYTNNFNVYSVGQVVSSTGIVERTGTNIKIQSTSSTYDNLESRILSTLAPTLEVGKTYRLDFEQEGVKNYIYLASGFVWYKGETRTITQNDLDSMVYFYISTKGTTGYYKNVMIQESDNYTTSYIPYGETCTNKLDEQTDAINGINDSINDDNVDSSSWSNFFNNFTTNTFGLTSIVTAPLNLIQSLTSTTCTDLQIPLPYLNNKYLTLPCMTSIYSQYFGSFFTLYQSITYGIIAYWVCVRIFNLVKDFKNPEHDEIEVVDL